MQKEMLEQSLQQHFKKTDKFSGAMKNLIDEHKREVKRVRIRKNEQLFKSYTPSVQREGPNMFLVDSAESTPELKYGAINSPSSTGSKEILMCSPRNQDKSEQQGSSEDSMEIIDM